MKIRMLFIAIFFQVGGVVAQEKPAAVVLEPEAFQKEMKQVGVQLIDVRTPEEFEEGHLAGARNIDYKSDDFLQKMLELDREKPLLIYCRSGNRSGKAARLLSENGFGDITDLKGGYLLWEEYLKLKQ